MRGEEGCMKNDGGMCRVRSVVEVENRCQAQWVVVRGKQCVMSSHYLLHIHVFSLQVAGDTAKESGTKGSSSNVRLNQYNILYD